MVYYAIALALYMGCGTREVMRCLVEGLRWLWGAEAVRVAGKSGISQARTRLGAEPLRRLYAQAVRPVATRATRGAWYRRWRLVSLDGSCLDVADTAENRTAFGRPEGRPRRERLPAAALRGPGGERHARAVRCAPGPIGSSSAMRSGRKRPPAAPTCSGG